MPVLVCGIFIFIPHCPLFVVDSEITVLIRTFWNSVPHGSKVSLSCVHDSLTYLPVIKILLFIKDLVSRSALFCINIPLIICHVLSKTYFFVEHVFLARVTTNVVPRAFLPQFFREKSCGQANGIGPCERGCGWARRFGYCRYLNQFEYDPHISIYSDGNSRYWFG